MHRRLLAANFAANLAAPLAAPLAALLLTAGLAAQDGTDRGRPLSEAELRTARKTVENVFDRPAGTRIGTPQREGLAAFLRAHEGRDLGPLGYLPALALYLERDTAAATGTLEAWMERDQPLPEGEHRAMCGRILLAAALRPPEVGQSVDAAAMARRVEGAARLYPDRATIRRALGGRLERGGLSDAEEDAVVAALLRGSARAGADDAELAETVRVFLAPDAAPPADRAVPMLPISPLRRPAGGDADRTPDVDLIGKPAPELSPRTILEWSAAGGDADAPTPAIAGGLRAMRGKVVVLDFFATWCGPCRKAVPELVALSEESDDDVSFLTVTRLYGRGIDFSAGQDAGRSVRDLDEEGENAINLAFLKAWEVPYPLIVVDPEVHRSYGVRGIPTLVVIGPDGKVVGRKVGLGPDGADEIRAMIRKAKERAGR